MEDLISVIVPVYNGEKYIRDIAEALQKQTYKNLEVIIVDDGSTDDTLKLCMQYMKDERFYIFHKENGGVSTARNYGKAKATGKYIAFVDADDYILPGYFSYLYKLLKIYDADMACCNYYKMRRNEKIPIFQNDSETICFSADDALADMLYNKNIMAGPILKLIKKEIVDQIDFPIGICYGEDLYFNIQIIRKCQRIVYGKQILYVYYQNPDSAVHNLDYEKVKKTWNLYQNEILSYIQNEKKELLNAAYSWLFIRATDYCCQIWQRNRQDDFIKELLAKIKFYGAYVIRNKDSKKVVRILAAFSCINTNMLVWMCEIFLFMKRIFRFETRRGI